MTMEKSVDYMIHEFSSVRTGKASPALVENIDVQAYGSTMKLKQLALITTPEPRLLVVQPFDASTVQDIEKALQGIEDRDQPAVDGKDHSPADSGALRGTAQGFGQIVQANGRRSARARPGQSPHGDGRSEKAQKAGGMTEDELRDLEETIQKLTDRFVKSVDDHLERKDAEVMKI